MNCSTVCTVCSGPHPENMSAVMSMVKFFFSVFSSVLPFPFLKRRPCNENKRNDWGKNFDFFHTGYDPADLVNLNVWSRLKHRLRPAKVNLASRRWGYCCCCYCSEWVAKFLAYLSPTWENIQENQWDDKEKLNGFHNACLVIGNMITERNPYGEWPFHYWEEIRKLASEIFVAWNISNQS